MPPVAVTCVRIIARLLTVVVVVVAAMAPRVASAHTDFDFSVPADGASVDEPVAEITVAFTLPVTPVGNGFEVLDPQADLLQPVAVSDDDRVFVLRFDPPLAGGAVGVRYEVTAEDGHVLSGAFSFTVDAAPAPTTTMASATTTAVPADEPATESTIAQPSTAVSIVETAADDTVPPSTTTTTAAASEGATADDGPTPETTASDSVDETGGSNVGIYVALAALVAAGGAGFLIARSRSTG
jgi:methionine-rich copper-binding protein CopC